MKLSPRERLLINGAVVENGDRRTRVAVLTPNAHVLRLRDAIHPRDANTPVKRVCYSAQLLLSGDADTTTARTELLEGIEKLSLALRDDDSRALLRDATTAILEERYYHCLKLLRNLLPREERLLAVGELRASREETASEEAASEEAATV